MFKPRTLTIAVIALLLHAVLLYALQTGLAQRLVDKVMPVVMLTTIEQPPEPIKAAVPPPTKVTPTTPIPVAAPTPPAPPTVHKPVEPQKLVASPSLPPATNAPVGTVQPAAAPAPVQAATPPAPVKSAGPVAVALGQLRCSDITPLASDYPPMSLKMEEEGTATVRLTIGESGAVEDVRIEKTSGFPRLDAAALRVGKRAQCRPYLVAGRAQSVTAPLPVGFTLN